MYSVLKNADQILLALETIQPLNFNVYTPEHNGYIPESHAATHPAALDSCSAANLRQHAICAVFPLQTCSEADTSFVTSNLLGEV